MRCGALVQSVRPQLKRSSACLWAFVLPFTIIAAQAQSKKAADEQDQKESYAYILTMEKINKLEEARKAVNELLEDNKQTSKRIDDDKSLLQGTLAQRARALDINHPDVAATIRKQGISTREYLLAGHVLFKAFTLVGAKKAGEIQDYSNAGEGINPANLTLVEQHWEEIRKSMQQGTRLRM